MTMFQLDYANPPQVNTENAGRLIETLSSSCLLLYEVQQQQQLLVIPQQHVSLNQYVAQCVAHKNVKPDVTNCGKSPLQLISVKLELLLL